MSAEDVKAVNAYTEKRLDDYFTWMEKNVAAQLKPIVDKVSTLDSGVADEVWDEQIPDVLTPESGDTAAARTHLTWMPKRVADQIMAALQPQLDDIKLRLQRIEDDTDDGAAAPKA